MPTEPNRERTRIDPSDLVVYAEYADEFYASAVAEFLCHSGVPAEVRRNSPLPGLTHVARVLVPSVVLDRARSLCEEHSVSETELERLASATRGDE